VRRTGPRRFDAALDAAAGRVAPAGLLAQVQACWPGVAGPALAAEATPVSEHRGKLTLNCRSAVWAQELELLAPDLLARLNRALSDEGAPSLTELRFMVGPAVP
jgi:predicted nucleic acid-binding Zn ribbon protein